jgi:hypothetical protein
MKKLVACGFVLTALCLCAQSASAFQGASGRDMNTPSNRGGSSAGKGTKGGGSGGGRTPVREQPPPLAHISIRTSRPDSTVFLNGERLGRTDASGLLRLPARKAGQYRLTVLKDGYHRHERVLNLTPGENGLLDVSLTAMPGRLRVNPKPDAADIHIGGVGSYNGSAEAELQAGDYLVRITKLGYEAVEQTVRLRPGQSLNLTLTLMPLPPSDLLALAESSFRAGQFDQTLTFGGMAYPHLSTNARLNFIIGISHLRKNSQAESLGYLRRAIELGESLTFNVKHFHKLKKGEGLCQGQLVLRRGELEFRSGDSPADSFRVAVNRVTAMRLTSDRGGGLSMKVYLMALDKKKKMREQWVDYDFHPPEAALQRKDPRKANSPQFVTCYGCAPTAQFFYTFVEQLSR